MYYLMAVIVLVYVLIHIFTSQVNECIFRYICVNIYICIHSFTVSNDIDCRITFFKENPQMSAKFIKKLFIVLYQVYNSSVSISIPQTQPFLLTQYPTLLLSHQLFSYPNTPRPNFKVKISNLYLHIPNLIF